MAAARSVDTINMLNSVILNLSLHFLKILSYQKLITEVTSCSFVLTVTGSLITLKSLRIMEVEAYGVGDRVHVQFAYR